jgi:hypothetical protein
MWCDAYQFERTSMLDDILAEYRYQLTLMEEWALLVLVAHYGLIGHDKASCIDALVDHFKKQLEDNA